ncbi:MAG TPA: FkbM family methyltransferase [Steroidobacteraceae bacterium]|nr:FkbM family methyltransferase [Steroidobacteraceae bacterium]
MKLSLRGASPRVRYRLFRDYELDDVQLCRAVLRPGDKVIELGSAVGFLALYCMKYLGVREFAAVEANPALRDVMQENFRVNGVGFPTCINAAVGPVQGTVSFNISRDYFSSSLRQAANTVQSLQVPQRTIPDILASLPFRPNALIMDIEGAEVDLPVSHLCLFDKIVAEFHGRMVGEEKVDALIGSLLRAGYRIVERRGPSLALVREAAGVEGAGRA